MTAGVTPLLLAGIPVPVAAALSLTVAVAVQLLLQHSNVDYRVGPFGHTLAQLVEPFTRHGACDFTPAGPTENVSDASTIVRGEGAGPATIERPESTSGVRS